MARRPAEPAPEAQAKAPPAVTPPVRPPGALPAPPLRRDRLAQTGPERTPEPPPHRVSAPEPAHVPRDVRPPGAARVPPAQPAPPPAVPLTARQPLPAAVSRALERLGAHSLRLPASTDPVSGPPPARPAVSEPVWPLRTPAVTPVVGPRAQRDEPVREPQVRIGTIEVTIAAPPPPPAPAGAPAPRPLATAPATATRLSRPPASYGLGQG
jgi:hypothetical protein